MRRFLVLPLTGLVLLAGPGAALAAPTCPDPATRVLCGGRVVPEASMTLTLHQYDGALDSLAGTLTALQGIAPKGFFTPMVVGKSAGGRDVWVVKLTDPSVPRAKKVQSAISLSVHGLEGAGREGGLRYLEDLATWLRDEPAHPMYAGSTAVPVSKVFQQVELYVGFLNPDGWSMQDLDQDDRPGTSARFNSNGADLNRDFPTLGWADRSGGRGRFADQPESRLWYSLLQGLPDLRSAGDIHGEITSTNSAFSDLLWPAGVWTPDHQAKELQLAKDMISDVNRKFVEDGVVLADLFGPTIGQKPAEVATGYDAVGYDDSGFMGDSMQRLNGGRVVEIDTENFLSNAASNVAYVSPLEAAHVAAVRGNMETIIVTAIKERTVTSDVRIGRVAFVDDPSRVRSGDGTRATLLAGEKQLPYDVSRLDYFPVLAKDAGRAIKAIPSADVSAASLAGIDSLVLSDTELPRDSKGRPVSRPAFVKALQAFVARGGQLVLTDRAVTLLDDLGIGSKTDQTLQRTNAGHVDFATFTDTPHPFERGLYGVPSQTYYEVPLGFPATNQSPHFGITQSRWEALGGTTVGTVGTSTVLGELRRGAGKITIFGAVLPQPVERLDPLETPHPEGLAGYAVTIAGAQVLHNILGYDSGTRGSSVPVAAPVVAGPTTSLPTTGGSGLLATTGLVALSAALLRRRRGARA